MKYEKGQLIIDASDFVERLYWSADEAGRRDFCDTISTFDPVIDHVIAQVIDGCTEFCSWAATDTPSESEPRHAIDRARRYIASNAKETAKDEIKRLEKATALREQETVEAQARYSRALAYVSDTFTAGCYSAFFEATYGPKAVSK